MPVKRPEDENFLQMLGESLAHVDVCANLSCAAAVSGGPDSMAMLWLLSCWAAENGTEIFAFTVDHGLRAESAEEAARVAAWVGGWPCVTHQILRWDGVKPETKILEAARAARYDLIAAEMKKHGIRHLLTAHHRDDQAETVLFRLAKGSGIDGLSGMRARQERGEITILRPLLDVPKAELVALCDANAVPYVRDPTNENGAYLRPRLRAARDVLEAEGLNAARLAVLARRMGRASAALETLGQTLYKGAAIKEDNAVLIDMTAMADAPEELRLRVLSTAMEALDARSDPAYPVRLERLEALEARIFGGGFTGATLGGCKFSLQKKARILKIERE